MLKLMTDTNNNFLFYLDVWEEEISPHDQTGRQVLGVKFHPDGLELSGREVTDREMAPYRLVDVGLQDVVTELKRLVAPESPPPTTQPECHWCMSTPL